MTDIQKEATNYLKDLLSSRGIQVEPGIFLVGEEGWQIFEFNQKCIGIDPSAAIWVGHSGQKWECISATSTVSGALQAVEFLMN
jgi:hypothetical protein